MYLAEPEGGMAQSSPLTCAFSNRLSRSRLARPTHMTLTRALPQTSLRKAAWWCRADPGLGLPRPPFRHATHGHRNWGVSDVASFLVSIELGDLVEAFQEGSVDGPLFLQLSPEVRPWSPERTLMHANACRVLCRLEISQRWERIASEVLVSAGPRARKFTQLFHEWHLEVQACAKVF